jgi:hypothetical protein
MAEKDGYAELAGDGGVVARLGHGRPVQLDLHHSIHGVGQRRLGFAFGGVVPDEDGGAITGVDAFHHAQRARPAPDEVDAPVEPLDVQVLGVAVGVAHQHVGRPRLEGGGDRDVDLPGHELPELLVLASLGAGLNAPGGHAAHPLHVRRDVDLELLRLGPGRARREQSRDRHDEGLHAATSWPPNGVSVDL